MNGLWTFMNRARSRTFGGQIILKISFISEQVNKQTNTINELFMNKLRAANADILAWIFSENLVLGQPVLRPGCPGFPGDHVRFVCANNVRFTLQVTCGNPPVLYGVTIAANRDHECWHSHCRIGVEWLWSLCVLVETMGYLFDIHIWIFRQVQ